MSVELIIAIIALTGVLFNSLLVYRASNVKVGGDITDIVFRAGEGIRKDLREDLARKDKKMEELDRKIESLNKAATDAYFVLSYIYNTASDLIHRLEAINAMIGGDDFIHIREEIEMAKAELESIKDRINDVSKN